MNPGELRHRVTIQANTPAEGGDSWANVRTQWANVQPVSASKLSFLSAEGSKVSHTVIFRRKPAVSTGDRFTYDGRTYQLVGVQIHDDRQEATAEVIQ